MKPSAHSDYERWRHDDVNLRRALQQRYAHVPTLPEGFVERMQQQMASRPRRRHFWPLYAMAAATAASLAIVLLLNKYPHRQPKIPVPPPMAESSTMQNPQTQYPAKELVAKHTPTTQKKEILLAETASQKHPETSISNNSNNNNTYPLDSIDTTEEVTVKTMAETTTADSSIVQPPISMQQREWTAYIPSTKRKKIPLTLVLDLSPTALGTDLAKNDENGSIFGFLPLSEQSAEYEETTHYRPHGDDYYLPIGNGYVYEFPKAETRMKAPSQAEVINHSNHRFPISLALLLNIPINKTFALETGLSYTRLRSTFDMGTTQSYSHTQQTLHYLGLPIHLNATIVQRSKWKFYASAGISIEFPIASSADIFHYYVNLPTKHTEGHLSPNVQVAPCMGLGLQYQLSTHLAIYVQPSLQWFPTTDSNISSYRTAHPVNVTIPFGLKWTF